MEIGQISIDRFVQNPANCLKFIEDHVEELPYLNITNPDDVRDGTLMRFRGMIQDMRDTEFYLDKYQIKNNDTGETYFSSVKYRDITDLKDNETIIYHCKLNITKERHISIGTSIPGLNDWVLEIEKNKYRMNSNVIPNMTESKQNKRPLEEDESMEMEANDNHFQPFGDTETSKKINSTPNSDRLSGSQYSTEFLLNLPLPDREGKVCILKTYEDERGFKLNEVFDFIGFVSVDPRMTQVVMEDSLFQFEQNELIIHHPPPSLIPRLHVVYHKRLVHVNPLVSLNASIPIDNAVALSKELKMIFTEVLFGDALAGSYLFYHLISTVYMRRDIDTVLGKFTLNLSNLPQRLAEIFGKSLYEIIETLSTHSSYFPMTLDNMNNLAFIPKKDSDAERLNSGILQLADNTHLVLDETQLSNGKLNVSGCQTVVALRRLITDQTLGYNFNFYNVDFNHNIPLLIISEGKSMLPSDYHVILSPSHVHVDTYAEVFPAVKLLLTQELLNDLRQYLTISRHSDCKLSEEIETLIQEKFVEFRREYAIKPQDLHLLLDLARLISLADGKTIIDKESFEYACQLEEERWLRIKAT